MVLPTDQARGSRTGASTDLDDYNVDVGAPGVTINCFAITTTGFSITMHWSAGFGNTEYFAFTWIAIGTLAK